MSLSRRDFIKAVSSGAVATTLTACGSDDSDATPTGSFEYGVLAATRPKLK